MIEKKLNKNYGEFPDSAFWIGGKHAVISAINNPLRKIYKIVLHERISSVEHCIEKNRSKIIYLKDKFFNEIFKSEIPHQGYAALLDKIEHGNFKDYIKTKQNIKKKSNILALDGVNDPRNIGSVIRTACAFNIDAILINKKDFNPKSFLLYKAASGTIENIPIFAVSNIMNEINFLKKEQYWIIGLDVNAKTTLHDYKPEEKNVIIFGSEEIGLKKIVRDNCDYLYKIPINKNVESLNVSNACSAALAIINYLQK